MSGLGFTTHRDPGKRRIKHTQKVKTILLESLAKAFNQALKDVGDMNDQVREKMSGNATVPEVKEQFLHWIYLNRQLRDLYLDIEEYATAAESSTYKEQLVSLRGPFEDLFKEVESYCEDSLEVVDVPLEHDRDSIGLELRTRQVTEQDHDNRPSTAGEDTSVKKVKLEAQVDGPGQRSSPKDEHVEQQHRSRLAALKREIAEMEAQTSRLAEELMNTMTKEKDRETLDRDIKPVDNSTPVSVKEQHSCVSDKVQTDGADSGRYIAMETSVLENLVKCTDRLESRYHSNLLPRLEPEVYDGDPLTYAAWWASFQIAVERNADSSAARVLYLLRYTKGEARESIEWFRSILDRPDVYERACQVLKSTFGNRTAVAEAYKDKLNKWPVIREGDARGLTKFGNYLMQCNTAMETLKFLSNIDSQEEIIKLVSKLPRSLQTRWNRQAHTHVYGRNMSILDLPLVEENDYPDFSTFSQFVIYEARILSRSNPAQTVTMTSSATASGGNPQHAARGYQGHGGRSRPQHSFGTQARTRPPGQTAPRGAVGPGNRGSTEGRPSKTPSCVFCMGEHYLSKCDQFLQNTPEFKKTYAKSRGLCFGCLSKSHLIEKCHWKNPDLLQSVGVPDRATSMVTGSTTGNEWDCDYYYMIVPVWVSLGCSEEQSVLTYALLDSQSSTSFISDELCDLLNGHPVDVELELTTLGTTKVINSRRLDDVRIKGFGLQTDSLELRRCYTRSYIPGDKSGIPDPDVVRRREFLREAADGLAPRMPEVDVHMLLGNDCHGYMKPVKVLQDEDDAMYAILTPLGWTVMGPVNPSSRTRISCLNTSCREVTQRQLREVFDAGFEEPSAPEAMMSSDDLKFLAIMEEGFQIVDGHIQLPLPLKQRLEELDLPESRTSALRCLFATKRRMIRDPAWGKKFAKFMNDLVEKKAEPVPPPDAILKTKSWYWPCHGVSHPRKPEKVRGVFNGSHEVEGFALNDILLQGPDLTNNLVGVLCRYRKPRKPLLCDIEGMFLQVLIAPEFRDLTRFVWFEDGDVTKPVRDYRMKVHLFGAKSSPSCANYAFRRTADLFEAKYGKEAADFVRRNFYVDDGLGGEDDNEKTVRLATTARAMCAETGFNLCKFASTDKEILGRIPKELVAKNLQNIELDTDSLPTDKALGVDISLEKDAFEYKVRLLDKPPTRRGCLSGLSSVYDPLGLVSPAILPGRQILQELCVEKLEWDDKLEPDKEEKWSNWYQNLKDLHELSIPRCIKRTIGDDIKLKHLHTFCDASITGLGAACYLHLQDAEQNDEVNLLYAKSKVAPTKVTTVPRLELQACVLGVKMANFLKSELDIEGLILFFWTDSMLVLIYINSEGKRFYMYVMNRAEYIRKNSEIENWSHIGTSSNPADLASRGCPARELVSSPIWFQGPPEIVQRVRERTKIPEIDPSDPELRKVVKVMKIQVGKQPQLLTDMLSRVSRWELARGCVAKILRYGQIRLGNVQAEAANRARGEVLVLKSIQKEAYPEYFRGVMESKGRLQEFEPFLDADGLLRVGGRNQAADVPYEQKHPLLIPERSRGTQLLIEHYHRATQHMSVSGTLHALRQAGYWLVRGRTTVKHYIYNCVVCKRRRGKGIVQIMAELPKERVTPAAPFTASAVDLFGPYRVLVRRSNVKRWICIFACMVSRAVHLEVVHSLSTSSYINAYRRFVSRRGPVKSIQCDCGTNFKGADSDIAKAEQEMDHGQVECVMAMKGCTYIRHTHNSPKASHMGGAWERLIRTVRAAMDYVLANPPSQLDDEILLTVVAEAEATVNARPLGYVDGSDPEGPLPLSPSMLLTLKSGVSLELPGRRSSAEAYLRQRWRYVQYLMKVFWDRWRLEILPNYNKRQKWRNPLEQCRVGTIVLVMDEQSPRPLWPLGRIEELLPGHDGRVRRVMVRIGGKLFERPIQKLIELMAPESTGSSPVKEP